MNRNLLKAVVFLLFCMVLKVSKAQWTLIGFPGEKVNCLYLAPPYIYAGTDTSGIHQSDISNIHWSSVNNGIPDTIFHGARNFKISGITANSNLTFVSTQDTLYASSDNGANWLAVYHTNGIVDEHFFRLAENQEAIFIMTNDLNNSRRVYRSIDNGVHWTNTGMKQAWAFNDAYSYFGFPTGMRLSTDNATTLITPANQSLPTINTGSGWIDIMAAVDTSIVYLSWTGDYSCIMRTTDNGANWDTVLHNPAGNTAAMCATGSKVFIGDDLGVRMSLDTGNTWFAYNNGIINSVAINDLKADSDFLYAATDQGVYKLALNQITGIPTFASQHAPSFRIYPNPASTAVSIVVDEALIGSTVTVNDITGREVNSVMLSTANLPTGQAGRELSTASFANGIYFVTIRKEGAVLSQKLVVQR